MKSRKAKKRMSVQEEGALSHSELVGNITTSITDGRISIEGWQEYIAKFEEHDTLSATSSRAIYNAAVEVLAQLQPRTS